VGPGHREDARRGHCRDRRGGTLVELLAPFQVSVVALTRSGRAVPGADASVGPEALDELLAASDYVVAAAPETPATRGLLSADRIALMREGAWLINVGRGSLVDTEALVAALRGGRIGGAVLDVTDPEPLPDGHALWDLPNAIVTSHSACTMELGLPALAERVRENVARFARGDELLGLVDVAAGY
jgi:phosphoglycerate dehydrogenase-like enzyme